jgi:hypothetical protein
MEKNGYFLTYATRKTRHFVSPLFIYKQSNFNIIIVCFYNITPSEGPKKEQQISLILTSLMEHVQSFEES